MTLKLKKSVFTALGNDLGINVPGKTYDLPTNDVGSEGISALMGLVGMPLGFLPASGSVYSAGAGKMMEYWQQRSWLNARLTPEQCLQLQMRGIIPDSSYDLPSSDMYDAGLTPERIDALRQLTYVIPQFGQLLQIAIKQGFNPTQLLAWGMTEGQPKDLYTWGNKVGLTNEWIDKLWASHWTLPSSGEAIHMFHRGIITNSELTQLLTINGIPSYWIDKTIAANHIIPPRLMLDRLWDYGIVDDAYVLNTFKEEGYSDSDALNMTVMTKVYMTLPDLIYQYAAGTINGDNVVSQLVALGLDANAAARTFQRKVYDPHHATRVKEERQLTKSEIIKGFNLGILNRDDAVVELEMMGYEQAEALYLLLINAKAAKATTATTTTP